MRPRARGSGEAAAQQFAQESARQYPPLFSILRHNRRAHQVLNILLRERAVVDADIVQRAIEISGERTGVLIRSAPAQRRRKLGVGIECDAGLRCWRNAQAIVSADIGRNGPIAR